MSRFAKAERNDDDTVFRDQNIIVLGDKAKMKSNAIHYVAVRYKPHIFYSDFLVKREEMHKIAPIQYSSNPIARAFKTIITNTYKNVGVNFAGHYCFVEWGCGSPCKSSALVDSKTGIVYNGIASALGYEYKKNSRMITVNPINPNEFYLNCPYCEPEIFIWNENKRKFVQR